MVESRGQNLIPNGGFEEGTGCPSFIGNFDEECLEWFSSIQYTDGTDNPNADWYYGCGEVDFLIPPQVAFGHQEPLDGLGYTGMIIYREQPIMEQSYREIIGVELNEPLTSGETYLVEFSIARLYSTGTAIAANNFGFKFSTIGNFAHDSLIVDNTASFKIDTIIADTANWLTVQVEVLADSNYSYIHFGNFFDNDNTAIFVDGDNGTVAYMALDAVSVSQVLSSSIAVSAPSIILFPNPTVERITISSKETIDKVEIYSVSGALLVSSRVYGSNSIEINLDNLSSGTYIVNIYSKNTSYYERIIKN